MSARTFLRGLAGLGIAIAVSTPAEALLFRAYLSVDGNDGNPCSLPQPCRLLPAALAAVASGGEIWLLDSANYNTATVNVTKSVKILAVPGAVGSVVATGGPAISIATAGVDVALRNLVIVPLPGAGGTYGVHMTAGNSLTVEQCLLAGLPEDGIRVVGGSAVKVVETTIRVSGDGIALYDGARGTVTRAVINASGHTGVHAIGSAAGTTTTVSIADSTLEGNLQGAMAWSMNATATVKLALSGSQLDRNGEGVGAVSQNDGPASAVVSGNVVTHSGTYAVFSYNPAARVWASGNTIAANNYGISSLNGGVFESAGNNAVRNNATDQFGTVTVVPMK
ncbi:MAG: right-handed parallel beta-helix repeat-containing protein [Burkholderiales bacterium]|nr:right-handed parallel beta-helix repeat-containing protein [Burkholderiales bacterium]MBZ0249768.1 right-handed parallel beta-helix repeat-containing protein [Burkholderiales bacterium]